MGTAFVIEGAQIVRNDGRSITYVRVCSNCGKVCPGTVSRNIGHGIMNDGFVCDRCNNHQNIRIQFYQD